MENYTVKWSSESSATITNGSTSFTITGLESSTTYCIQVTAHNVVGMNRSNSMIVQTSESYTVLIIPSFKWSYIFEPIQGSVCLVEQLVSQH